MQQDISVYTSSKARAANFGSLSKAGFLAGRHSACHRRLLQKGLPCTHRGAQGWGIRSVRRPGHKVPLHRECRPWPCDQQGALWLSLSCALYTDVQLTGADLWLNWSLLSSLPFEKDDLLFGLHVEIVAILSGRWS